MQISLSDAGKRFNRDWIFRRLSYQFISGKSYAITGPNGSGKSTLLQIIAGSVSASQGTVAYETGGKKVDPENAFTYISIAAPYQELIEEMTLKEFLHFHNVFKPLLQDTSVEDVINEVGLMNAAEKQIRYFSSGMKQRVKLAQAVFSQTPCLLLDEPCTNLDEAGIRLYQQLIDKYTRHRLVIVSSNDLQEYGFCEERLDIMEFKR